MVDIFHVQTDFIQTGGEPPQGAPECGAAQQHGLDCKYLLEPSSRNTGPAILMAAFDVAARYGPKAIMLILPADHLITPVAKFIEDVATAEISARSGQIAVFGIPTKTPETGYGYIAAGEADGNGTRRVLAFTEKPDLHTAEHYVASPDHFWNAGIFCLSADTAIRAFQEYRPSLFAAAQTCWAASANLATGLKREFDASTFAACDSISVDYAILEKANNVSMVDAKFSWNDLGSWVSVAELGVVDERDNRSNGDVVMVNSDRCYVRSDGRLVATLGIQDLIIVDTQDALLVAHRSCAEDVKLVVAALKERKHQTALTHRTVARPWGTYTVLDEAKHYKIKRIEVHPGGTLSLQMHYHRSEHWVVVAGVAKVTNHHRTFIVRTNESTYIPAGHSHRLENPGKLPLIMIEVQTGEYVEEDDIVRFEDIYGRVANHAFELMKEVGSQKREIEHVDSEVEATQ